MKYYSVENYGALADGVTNDAKAIQSAIDDAEKNGGGTVVLESGKTYYNLLLTKGEEVKRTIRIVK